MIRPISTLATALALAAPALAQTAPATPAPADAGAAAPAAAGDISGTYAFDPAHSQIVFSYDHMGFSVSHGFVNAVAGSVTLDSANPANSTVEASFPLNSMRTIDAELDKHIMGPDFFNGAAPDTQVTFKSTSVQVEDDDEAKVTGDLTLNGVTRPVTLEVELRKAGPNPMTNKPAVGFEIEGKLKRSDFNLGAFAPAVSDDVELKISVEASKG
ncbi:MAG TPA: YceI family protein [Paracoccus sp. (in: a-proteobacteria)]|nr:YceI family protein [Paracoccus sp. (in: a-proteobacteria)]